MRVMVLIKATEQSEAGEMPSEQMLSDMTAFNGAREGGRHARRRRAAPQLEGRRVRFSGGERKVIDGPFAEIKELLAGYWVWQVKSFDEAVEWVKRIPDPMPGEEAMVEIRPVFEAEDFGEELTPELRARGGRMRRQVAGRPGPWATSTAPSTAVWRIESARLIAGVARVVRDVGLAEDVAQEALVAALEQWPESGVPDNPGAWLMATAKHRAIDRLRRDGVHDRKTQELGPRARGRGARRPGPRRRDRRPVRRRPAAADLHRLPPRALHRGAGRPHPAPARRPHHRRDRARLPRAGGDGGAADRARQAHARRGARPVRGPRARDELAERLAPVLEVVYLIFNEGYSATPASAGCGRTCSRRRSAWAACSPGCCPREPRCTGSSR